MTDNTLDKDFTADEPEDICVNCFFGEWRHKEKNFNCRNFDNGIKSNQDNTLDKEAIKLLQQYALSLGCTNYLYKPKEQREAVAKFKSLIADREKKMLEFVIPEKATYKCVCGKFYAKAIGYCECGAFIANTEKDTNEVKGYNKAIDEQHQRAKEWQESEGEK